MNEKEIYTNSILTFAFTNDGRMIIRKDKKGKIDTLPWLFMGYRENDSRIDYEDSCWIMNDMDDYKERMVSFFAYHLRNARDSILFGLFSGNKNLFLDVGELYGKIANHQIEEMKTMQTPSYIRVNNGLYNGGTNQNNQSIINKIETRYIVFPGEEDIQNFPELEAKNLSELKEEFSLLSDKIVLGITGKDGEVMESFVNCLKSLGKNKSSSPKR